jgi:hypothetical protein
MENFILFLKLEKGSNSKKEGEEEWGRRRT